MASKRTRKPVVGDFVEVKMYGTITHIGNVRDCAGETYDGYRVNLADPGDRPIEFNVSDVRVMFPYRKEDTDGGNETPPASDEG